MSSSGKTEMQFLYKVHLLLQSSKIFLIQKKNICDYQPSLKGEAVAHMTRLSYCVGACSERAIENYVTVKSIAIRNNITDHKANEPVFGPSRKKLIYSPNPIADCNKKR